MAIPRFCWPSCETACAADVVESARIEALGREEVVAEDRSAALPAGVDSMAMEVN